MQNHDDDEDTQHNGQSTDETGDENLPLTSCVVAYPSAPNWYCSCTFDFHKDSELLVYASRNVGVVVDCQLKQGGSPRDRIVLNSRGVDPVRAPFVTGTLQCSPANARITAVGFVQQTLGGHVLCVTGTNSGKVDLWDVTACSVLETEADAHPNSEITTVLVHGSKVVTTDAHGRVVVWEPVVLNGDRQKATVTIGRPLQSPNRIVCAALSMDGSQIAIGLRTGMIVLYDLQGQSVCHRFTGHDEEIQGLSWHPSVSNLLCSTSRDRKLVFWDTGSCHTLGQLKLMNHQAKSKKQGGSATRAQQQRLWFSHAWYTDPTCDGADESLVHLVTGSFSGDLLRWDVHLKQGTREVAHHSFAPFQPGHSRPVFNVLVHGNVGLSLGMDRQVRIWDIPSMRSTQSVPGFGGHVYAIDTSPTSASTVAVSVGDNILRVWNTNDKSDPFASTLIWRGIQAKLTTVKWHPSEDGAIAYGCEDGRVGICNCYSSNHTKFHLTHKQAVTGLHWRHIGGETGDDPGTWVLYSVGGDGGLIEHQINGSSNTASRFVQTELLEKLPATQRVGGAAPSLTAISWSTRLHTATGHDFDLLAAALPGGGVAIFSIPGNCFLGALNEQETRVSFLRFFHQHTADVVALSWSCTGASPDDAEDAGLTLHDSPTPGLGWAREDFWLASCAKDCTGRILKMDAVVDVIMGSTTTVNVDNCAVTTQVLHGHQRPLTDIKWNVKDLEENRGGKTGNVIRIATASFDGSAQIWDARSGAQLANCRGSQVAGRVRCLEWLTSKRSILLSGGDDQMIRAWDVNQQRHSGPPKGRKAGGKVRRNPKAVANAVANGTLAARTRPKEQLMMSIKASPGINDQALIALVQHVNHMHDYRFEHGGFAFLPPVRLSLGGPTEKGRGIGEIFNFAGLTERTKDLVVHDDITPDASTPGQEEEASAMTSYNRWCALFANDLKKSRSPSGLAVVMEEAQQYFLASLSASATEGCSSQNKPNNKSAFRCGAHLVGWSGNIVPVLNKMIETKQLTADWVAIAPMAGLDVWRRVTVAFAEQQLVQGNVHGAALSYLSIGDSHAAVRGLQEAGKLDDALALASCRLPCTDPLRLELMREVADLLGKRRLHVLSAIARMSCGELTRAVRSLHAAYHQLRKEEAPAVENAVSVEAAKSALLCMALQCSFHGEDGSFVECAMDTCRMIGDHGLTNFPLKIQYLSSGAEGVVFKVLHRWVTCEQVLKKQFGNEEFSTCQALEELETLVELIAMNWNGMVPCRIEVEDDLNMCDDAMNQVMKQRTNHKPMGQVAKEITMWHVTGCSELGTLRTRLLDVQELDQQVTSS